MLSVDGYVIADNEDLDRAGDWFNCPEPDRPCKFRAYLTAVHATLEEAVASIDERAKRLAASTVTAVNQSHRLTREDPIPFYVHRLSASGIVGRDYRDGGCTVVDGLTQLRTGARDDSAWIEIDRQRVEESVEGALLPGWGSTGELFLFVDAAHRIDSLTPVEKVCWRDERHGGSTRHPIPS
jgi:hypothetical protein